ncbi:MAG: hypothetical protein JXA11_08665 [Phycisphaerae bacterium]|nr:hypothetical protein [Phycisphaerae bacterium]
MPFMHNPLMYRGVRSSYGRNGFWGWMIGLGLLLLFILFCIHVNAVTETEYSGEPSLAERTGYRFGWFCFAVEMFAAIVVTLWVMSDSVVQERKQNTYEFLETLPLRPSGKAIGLLVGRCVGILTVTAVTGVVGTISALIGGVELERILWLHVIALCGFTASGFLGLSASIGLGRVSLGGLIVVVFLVFSLGISGALMGDKTVILPLLPVAPLASLSWSLLPVNELPAMIRDHGAHFYSISIPWQAAPVILYLFFAAVFFLAARRGLTRPEAPRSPRWHGLIVLAMFHALLIGFIADFLNDGGESGWQGSDRVDFCLLYLAGFGGMILIWMILHSPSLDNLVHWLRYRPRGPMGSTLVRGLFDKGSPAWLAGLILWAITAAVVLTVNHHYFHGVVSAGALLAVAGVWLLFLLGYTSLFQAGVLTSRKSGSLLGIVFLVVAILAPSLLAAVSSSAGPLYVTPVGMVEDIGYLFRDASSANTRDAWNSLLYNAFGGLAILLVGQAWSFMQLTSLTRQVPPVRQRQVDAG